MVEMVTPFKGFGPDTEWYNDKFIIDNDIDGFLKKQRENSPNTGRVQAFWLKYTLDKWAYKQKFNDDLEVKLKTLKKMLIMRYGEIVTPEIWDDMLTCHVVEDNLKQLHLDMAVVASLCDLKSVSLLPCDKGVVVAFSNVEFSLDV